MGAWNSSRSLSFRTTSRGFSSVVREGLIWLDPISYLLRAILCGTQLSPARNPILCPKPSKPICDPKSAFGFQARPSSLGLRIESVCSTRKERNQGPYIETYRQQASTGTAERRNPD